MSLSGVYRAANLQSLALHTHDDELLRGDSEELVVAERGQPVLDIRGMVFAFLETIAPRNIN